VTKSEARTISVMMARRTDALLRLRIGTDVSDRCDELCCGIACPLTIEGRSAGAAKDVERTQWFQDLRAGSRDVAGPSSEWRDRG